MIFKKMLRLSTSLVLVCGGLMSHYAHAEDYITKSQVNSANGVAGLNSSKQVTTDVNNSIIDTDYVHLKKHNDRLRFITNSGDTNNNMVDMFYNGYKTGLKDVNGKLLTDDTFYFTNNMYGNKYVFNGSVDALSVSVNGRKIIDPIPGGYESIDPYITNTSDSSLVFMSKTNGYDSTYMKPNTLMIGGRTRNAVVGIKATCQNTGQGDKGGSCYQFTDMSGPEWYHRGGAGYADGINMDMRTSDNSPMDTVGGNTLIKNTDGSYTVKGNEYTPTSAITVGATSFFVNGSFGCGINDGKSRCAMTGINVLDENAGYFIDKDGHRINTTICNIGSDGKYTVKNGYSVNDKGRLTDSNNKEVTKDGYFIDKDGYLIDAGYTDANNNYLPGKRIINPVTVTRGQYNVNTDTTEVKLPIANTVQDSLTTNSKLEIINYSTDGTAYGIAFEQDSNGSQYAAIYPSLSEKERNLTHARMAVWSNIANGMHTIEGGTDRDQANVDMPNYYYGYADGFGDTVINQSNINSIKKDNTKTDEEKDLAIRQNKVTKIYMRSFSYPGLTGDLYKWKTLSNALKLKDDPNVKSPLLNTNDQVDNRMAYACPTKDQLNDVGMADIKKNAYSETAYHIINRPSCFDKANIPLVVKNEQLGNIKYNYNTNYHYYQKPTLFLGMIHKNFNLYTQQTYIKSADSITREFDNEWDFPMYQNHDGQVSVHGLTMVFNGGGYPLANGSHMLRLAGFDSMPLGLQIDGVWPYGGQSIIADGGFFINNWSRTGNGPYLKNINDVISISGLGQAKTSEKSYQLMTYMSNDGNIKDNNGVSTNKMNDSLHLGLTKQITSDYTQSLSGNRSPTCNNDGQCSVLGQVIFDPLGYVGGIALGSGQGDKTKLGLVVDKDNIVRAIDIRSGNLRANMLSINSANKIDDIFPVRFDTGEADTNNLNIDLFYNKTARKDGWGNLLDAQTFYFSNHHYGNNYKFVGSVGITNKLSAKQLEVNDLISSPKYVGVLSTPSSSSATCTVGEFKDDTNYHYVCVATNKWKRAALSNF